MTKFWETKKLEELTPEEWESLCCGCGKCCLNKIEDNGKIFWTNAHCRFFNPENCRCKIYYHRFEAAKDCNKVNMQMLRETPCTLPKSCIYRMLYEGRGLPAWHPLISKDENSVHHNGISLKNRPLVNETEVKNYDDYIVDWEDL